MEIRTARGRLFVFLSLLMALPLLQHCFKLVHIDALNGGVTGAANVKFSWAKWWDKSYQDEKSAYLNDSTGFRPDLVRINNQIDFSLFKKVHANGVVVGTNSFLYEKGYIKEYCGDGFQGDSAVRVTLVKLKAIQDTLAHLGKTLLFVYAPSKAYIFPKNFPEELQCDGSDKTFYHSFRRLGDSLGINQIDVNGWFMQLNGKTDAMLMGKNGTHWTYYGALLAADSITGYIEKARHISMPVFKWTKMEQMQPSMQEHDLVDGLNLMFNPVREKFYFPVLENTNDSGKVKPSVIFLGDSFLWTFVYIHAMDHCSDNWEFWYYFNEVWTAKALSGKEQMKTMSDYDWTQSLLNKDCVVILYTEANLWVLGNGFIEKAYDHFYPNVKNK